jgi:GTP cyclohydrolase I
VEARHTCSIMRGDNFSSSNLITSSMHGSFRSNSKTRQEFLSHIEKNIL